MSKISTSLPATALLTALLSLALHACNLSPAPPTATTFTAPATLAPTSTSTATATATAIPTPTQLPFVGMGQIAFISDRDGSPEIYVMNADGSGQTRLTINSAYEFDPVWSPDGARIAFSSNLEGNEDIYLMYADGSGLVRLTHDLAADRNPAWSPDGTQIVFVSQRDAIPGFEGPPQELYVMNSDGSRQTRLTHNTTSDYCPAWSPLNDRIAFSSFFYLYDSVRIDTITTVGSQPAPLIDTPGHDYCPRWSPDGSRIAFVLDYDGDTQNIFLVNTDGSDLTNLTDNPTHYRGLAWSPDGNWIVFSSQNEEEWDISVVSFDGSVLINLTQDSGSGGWSPSWRP
jgi:Tol biopolymer transport system component